MLWLTCSLLLSSVVARGQGTTTVTSNPANGATGVSVSANVVFTFSAPIDTTTTTATFISTSPFGSYPVTEVWSGGDTVLTCTPVAPFPANVTITWFVSGQDTASGQVFAQGTFTTGTGGGGGGTGSGTNAITGFSAGKFYYYEQLAAGAPTPMPDASYGLFASTTLASNRTATAVTVTVPGTSSGVSLTQDFLHHEHYTFFTFSTNQTTFESTYPQGDYVFNVTGTPANLQGTVTLPASMTQPNAPHVANFLAAQAINASQAFTLSWDAFQNGTTADFITVSIDNGSKTIFQTPGPGTNGALIGTVTSVAIPAGTLASNSTNTADITFYHITATTNASYAALAFRATTTRLGMVASGSVVSSTPVVSKPTWGPAGFGFDVATSVNQTLLIRHSSDLSQWQTLFTTNSPGTSVHITVPIQAGASDFFRVQNGP